MNHRRLFSSAEQAEEFTRMYMGFCADAFISDISIRSVVSPASMARTSDRTVSMVEDSLYVISVNILLVLSSARANMLLVLSSARAVCCSENLNAISVMPLMVLV